MSFKDEMSEMFSKKTTPVVVQPLVFKHKLSISDKSYKFLRSTNSMKEFMEILCGGGAAAGALFAGWSTTLGFWGGLSVAIGFTTTPIGWITAAGGCGMAAVYSCKKIMSGAKSKCVDEIPKFIKTPIDILAISISSLVIPVSLKIGLADGLFHQKERECIIFYFRNEWGIDEEYISEQLTCQLKQIDKFSLEKVREDLLKLSEFYDELEYNVIAKEIIRLSRDVMNINKQCHPLEEKEIAKIEHMLGV